MYLMFLLKKVFLVGIKDSSACFTIQGSLSDDSSQYSMLLVIESVKKKNLTFACIIDVYHTI